MFRNAEWDCHSTLQFLREHGLASTLRETPVQFNHALGQVILHHYVYEVGLSATDVITSLDSISTQLWNVTRSNLERGLAHSAQWYYTGTSSQPLQALVDVPNAHHGMGHGLFINAHFAEYGVCDGPKLGVKDTAGFEKAHKMMLQIPRAFELMPFDAPIPSGLFHHFCEYFDKSLLNLEFCASFDLSEYCYAFMVPYSFAFVRDWLWFRFNLLDLCTAHTRHSEVSTRQCIYGLSMSLYQGFHFFGTYNCVELHSMSEGVHNTPKACFTVQTLLEKRLIPGHDVEPPEKLAAWCSVFGEASHSDSIHRLRWEACVAGSLRFFDFTDERARNPVFPTLCRQHANASTKAGCTESVRQLALRTIRSAMTVSNRAPQPWPAWLSASVGVALAACVVGGAVAICRWLQARNKSLL